MRIIDILITMLIVGLLVMLLRPQFQQMIEEDQKRAEKGIPATVSVEPNEPNIMK